MLAILIQIDAWDPATLSPITLRAASHDDPALCLLNGQTWWPSIAKAPTLRYDLFDGSFEAQISAPTSTVRLQTEPFPNFGRYILAGGRIRVWTGNLGSGFGTYTLRFDGRIIGQPEVENGGADIEFGVDDRWLDTSILATYAGTTGAEGPAALKGQVKPLALGAPRYVPGVLIDSVNSVFQVSGYGNVQGFEAALEKLARFPAPVADYASYDALVAATIAPGNWATAKAVGMARFGAPPAGTIDFLVQGDAAGPNGWARKPGQLIRRLALLAGGAGKINDASLNALDLARPYNLSVYLDQQTTARDLIQKIAASVNAVAGVTWTGQLFCIPVGLSAPAQQFNGDGTTLPPVASVKQIDMAAPWQKLSMTAERAYTVHALADIAFSVPLIDMGRYNAATTYREGNIVDLADGSRWRFVNATPSAGHAPAPGAYWTQLSPKTLTADITYASGETIESLKPDEPGANVTGSHTASGIFGQGALATLASLFFGSPYLLEQSGGAQASLAAFKTILGQAASFAGQGSLATLNSLANGGPYLSGFGALAALQNIRMGGPASGYAGIYNEGGGAYITDALYKTSLGTASAIAGQGSLATKSQAAFGSDLSGLPYALNPGNAFDSNGRLFAERLIYQGTDTVQAFKPQEAGANVTENRTAAGFSGQGPFATAPGSVSIDNTTYFQLPDRIAPLRNGDGRSLRADRIIFDQGDGYGGNYQVLSGLRPLEPGANVTETRTAASIVGQNWGATAARGLLDNDYVARGANLVPNSDQTTKIGFLQGGSYGIGLAVGMTFASQTWGSDSYALPRKKLNNIYVVEGAPSSTANAYIDFVVGDESGTFISPCAPGDRFIGSCYIANHRCRGEVFIAFVDRNGSFLSAYESGPQGPTNNYTNILSAPYYIRHVTPVGIAPAGSTGVLLTVRKYSTVSGETNSYQWWAAPMLERAGPSQTTASPYVSGPASSTRDLGFTGETDADRTGIHTAASINGQGGLATKSSVTDSELGGYLVNRLTPYPGDANYMLAGRVAWADGNTVQNYKPQEAGANVTESRTSAAFSGQGSFATVSNVNRNNVGNYFTYSAFSLNYSITRSDGVNVVTEALAITSLGMAAGFAGQGALASRNQAGYSDIDFSQLSTSTSDANSAGASGASSSSSVVTTYVPNFGKDQVTKAGGMVYVSFSGYVGVTASSADLYASFEILDASNNAVLSSTVIPYSPSTGDQLHHNYVLMITNTWGAKTIRWRVANRGKSGGSTNTGQLSAAVTWKAL